MLNLGIVDRAQRVIGRAISMAFLAIAGIIAWEVCARYLFNAPTIWAHELTATLSALGFLFGGAYALERGEHIRITSLYAHLPVRLQWWADLVAHIVTLFYIGGMIYAGWIVAGRAWATIETSASAWNQPTPVVIKTALVVASALIAIQTIVNLLRLFGVAHPSERPEG